MRGEPSMGSRGARALDYVSVGEGPDIVVMSGYAMRPSIYLPMARLLADRARVVIPAIFQLPDVWTFDHAIDCIELTLEALDIREMTLLGHSFGGALELGLAARRPDQTLECVFSDTISVAKQLRLAREALSHPLGDLRLATPAAISSFLRSWVTHPVQLASAAISAFSEDRSREIERCADAPFPCHVLWAERDTILARKDGREFARRLDATFTVAERPPGYPPIDHDWMFDDPELFVGHLDQLGLRALSGA
jgi:pimeloyl-ACP methyl ester carboxylesterase